MPYDPRMLQMAQMGVRMMSPDQRNAFADPRSQQPRWEPAVQYGPPANQAVNTPDSQPANSPRKQPGMLDMMLELGRMTPQQYNQRIHGAPSSQQQGAAMVSPWAWLGNLGASGGGYR